MSNTSENPARPVSLFAIVFLFALFAAFFFFVRYFYHPAETLPQNAAAEKLPKDLEWRATAAARRTTLRATKDEQAKQLSSYGWVDQKSGVVRLPIERAMELTAQQYGKKQ
jgi:hypothetical protein